MNFERFVHQLTARLPDGLVMKNLGKGTSTIMWNDGDRVCYKRGGSRLYIHLRRLYDACCHFSGRVVSTTDLKDWKPEVFDSTQNGHSCHCTFLFMALRRMDVIHEISGTGRSGAPFRVTLPSLN